MEIGGWVMDSIKSYRDPRVWKAGMDLVETI